MATGTGKTAIIATLARCVPEITGVLVLAPRVALCEQLELDIRKRTFERLERSPSPTRIPKTVYSIEKALLKIDHLDLRDSVIVSTIQMIETMMRSPAPQGHGQKLSKHERQKRRLKSLLAKYIDLVLVDEGHYEPAVSWSRALRHFKVPRILFTATPYRSDFKPFDIDYNFASHLTLSEGVQRHYIREVEVVDRPPKHHPREFIQDVLSFFDMHVKSRWQAARAIIRCDNSASIEQMAQLLREEGRSCIAIHENFKDKGEESWKRRTVPHREREEHWYGPNGPVFWIHQFKLLEGIDDDRFRLVALFEPLKNSRQLVQQVGRLIRNPAYPNTDTAFLLDHRSGHHRRRWEALFDYDDKLKTVTDKTPHSRRQFVDRVLEALPDPEFIDGAPRSRFSFEEFKPAADLLLPLTANFIQKAPAFNRGKFAKLLERQLEEDDRVWKRYDVDDTTVFVYVNITTAPFLDSMYFLTGTLGILLVCELTQLIAFYDSGGASPLGLAGLSKAARSQQLRRLFSGRSGSRLVEIAMKNAQLGHRAVRVRSLSAASVDETVPALDDHTQVLTRARGYSVEETRPGEDVSSQLQSRRRYVGFRRGRVVEAAEPVGLGEYIDWLDEIEQAITGRRKALATFSRYARQVEEPGDPAPRNILLDVFEVLDSFRTLGDSERGIPKDAPMVIEDLCQDVTRRRAPRGGLEYFFPMTANNVTCEVRINFDRRRRKYELSSPQLDRLYHRREGQGSLTKYLNDEQSFRVLPMSENVMYVDGDFYELALAVGARFDKTRYHVGKVLEPIAQLEDVRDEKGRACLADESDWAENSLFGLISRCGGPVGQLRHAFGAPDILVCDDLRTEIADFVVSDDSRVILIHAKAIGRDKNAAQYSASNLSDVCAQATKNLSYLSMFNDLTPKNLDRWEERWSAVGTEGAVRSRIRRAPRRYSAQNLWAEIRNRIQNPRTQREVWLVLGGMLSKSRLERELRKEPATAEAVQAVTLLHGTLAAIGSIDAKLRVFCHA